MFEITDVTAGYGESTVLRGVSLEVPDGTVAALLGPNGAGKTTLMRVAAGLIRPRAGQLTLGGADITRSSPNARVKRGLCHIPEGRGVFPSLTVRENLSLQSAPRQQAESIERAEACVPRPIGAASTPRRWCAWRIHP